MLSPYARPPFFFAYKRRLTVIASAALPGMSPVPAIITTRPPTISALPGTLYSSAISCSVDGSIAMLIANYRERRLTHAAFHLQLDQPVHFHRVFHRQLFHKRFDEPAYNHRASLCLGQPAAL